MAPMLYDAAIPAFAFIRKQYIMTLPFLLMYQSVSRRMRLRVILSMAVVTLLSSGYYNAFSQVQPAFPGRQYAFEIFLSCCFSCLQSAVCMTDIRFLDTTT